MAEHTPTPWHTDQVELFDTFNQVLGLIRTTANAAFIVRAVNCHEALVRELEDCELSLKLDVDEWGSPRLKGTLANIRAALAKAEESRLQQQDLDEETL